MDPFAKHVFDRPAEAGRVTVRQMALGSPAPRVRASRSRPLATLLQRGNLETSVNAYWVRVWAARGLLHGWDEPAADVATPAVVTALGDDAWRVREMAAKVVRRWQLAAATGAVAALKKDDVPRVRAAAARAVAQLAKAKATTPATRRRPVATRPSAAPRRPYPPSDRPAPAVESTLPGP